MFGAVVTAEQTQKALFAFIVCNQVQCDDFLEIDREPFVCGGQHLEDFALRIVRASFANRQAVLSVGAELSKYILMSCIVHALE